MNGNSFPLWVWQERDVATLRDLFGTHQRICYACPTGSGKTVIAGHICQLLRAGGCKVLILVHRKELVHQFMNTLRAAGLAHEVGIIRPGYPETPWAPIQLASVFSLVRREHILSTFDPYMVIVDEAHHARAKTWEDILKAFPRARVLGLTATPARLDGKALGTQFDHLHCGPSIDELVEWENLAPMRTFRLPSGFDYKQIRTLAGDWNKKDVAKQATKPTFVVKAVTAYQRYVPNSRAIFFGITIEHSKLIAQQMRDSGIRAEHVDGDTPGATRDRVMDMFRTGGLDMLCNVGLISEGFDCPSCDCIIDQQPTKSITNYMQKLGRAMRFEPDKIAMHLDLAGNIHHGLPAEERTWTLDMEDAQGETKEEGTPVSRLRTCLQCATVYASRLPACPTCGAPPNSKIVLEVDVELQEILPKTRHGKGKPKSSDVERRIREARRSADPWVEIERIRQEQGYPEGWSEQIAGFYGISPP